MAAKTLVQRLHTLASVEGNRHVIARDDTCLPCLVTFLKSSDLEISSLAMETLQLLSQEATNHILMANSPGLVSAIQEKLYSPNLETKRFALSAYATLRPFVGVKEDQDALASSSSSSSLPQSSSSAGVAGAASTQLLNQHEVQVTSELAHKQRAQSNLGEAQTVTIYLHDLLDEDDRQILEDALLQIKGVISLLIDIYAQKCVVRTHTAPDPLLAAICACGVSASLNTKQQSNNKVTSENDENTHPKGWWGWGGAPADQDDQSKQQESCAQQASESENTSSNKMVSKGQQQDQSGWFGRIARSLWG